MPKVNFLADTAHSDHADLPQRKQIVGRWLVSRDYATPQYESAPDLRMVDRVLDGARFTIREQEALSNTKKELSNALKDLLRAVRKYVGKERLPPRSLEELERSIAGINCNACAARYGREVCRGGIGDHKILADGAACLDPIFDLFQFLLGIAQDRYADMLPGNWTALSVRLVIEFSGKGEVSGAVALLEDDGLVRRVEVRLGLPNRLDSDLVGEAAYTLFHEIFVHGPEGWTADQRRMSDELCILREGLVDSAADFVLQRAFRDTQLPTAYQKSAARFAANAHSAYEARMQTSQLPDDDDHEKHRTNQRQRGRDIFQNLSLNNRGEDAALLAVAVNVLDLSKAEVGRAVVFLRKATQTANLHQPIDDRGKWSRRLSELMIAAKENSPLTIRTIIEQDEFDGRDF
jgi:hypothetical protein